MLRDDFDAWQKDHVTQWVMKAIRKAMDAERAEWMRQSWDAGKADQFQLIELRTRAEALGELIDNDFEKWVEWNGEDIEQD